jgi:gluconolactonase
MPRQPVRFFGLIVGTSVILILIGLWRGLFRPRSETGQSKIVRADPRFDRLLASDARLEEIATGFRLAEGPVWNKKGGYLLFSDIPANAVLRWQRGAGVELFLKPSGYSGPIPFKGGLPGSNGLAFDPADRLVLCEHGDRRITRLERDGSRTVLADRYHGKRLNSPNDLVFTAKGELYFTDPPFGLPGLFADATRELDFSGIYRLAVDGTLTLLSREVSGPNGIALSPSGRTLYVSDSNPARPAWLAFDVTENGLANRRVFADTPAWALSKSGPHDGMTVDRSGNVFASGPGGIHVFAPDGSHLGSIEVHAATNIAWGEDGSVLYITASTAVYRLQTLTTGF